LIPCFFLTFLFLSRAPRYFSFSFTLLATVNRCKLSYWISPTFTYMVRFLDCFILTERISYFVPKLEKFPKYNAFKVSLFTLFFSFFINSPYFFFLKIQNESTFYEAMTNITLLNSFTYCKREEFFLNGIGRIILYLETFLVDGITTLVEISLTITSIVLFNKFIKEKFQRLNGSNQICMNVIRIQLNSTTINDFNMNKTFRSLNAYNSRLTKTSIYLSTFSILINLTGVFATWAFIGEDNNIFGHYVIFIVKFLLYVKYISAFFFFFYLNDKFRTFIREKFYSLLLKLLFCE
jgi:hypothetical protein